MGKISYSRGYKVLVRKFSPRILHFLRPHCLWEWMGSSVIISPMWSFAFCLNRVRHSRGIEYNASVDSPTSIHEEPCGWFFGSSRIDGGAGVIIQNDGIIIRRGWETPQYICIIAHIHPLGTTLA